LQKALCFAIRLDLHLQRSPTIAGLAPGQVVDLRVADDLAGFVQLELLSRAGAEVTELDVCGHGTGVAEVGLTELARLLAPAGHKELLVMSGRAFEQRFGAAELLAPRLWDQHRSLPVITDDQHLALGADDQVAGARQLASIDLEFLRRIRHERPADSLTGPVMMNGSAVAA